MGKFEVCDEFYLDAEKFKIISGAIHYFRIVPEYWIDRLEKLRALGCNTVETYVPWNIHEPVEGEFDFDGIRDLRAFIRAAQSVGMFVILRPSPYICAEWEFGGLPFWLLNYPDVKLRTSGPVFMNKASSFMKNLLARVVDLQINFGGPIIMMQVENEYGGYANDLSYLRTLANVMRDSGVVVPLVTSDGPWHDMLKNGSIPELALPTMNCGSNIGPHFKKLSEFHGQIRPLMVMEFWIGWFDAWGYNQHHTTDIKLATDALDDILKVGSVNIYMFHGGTNFGFMNGANYYEKLAPDTTSYDYDALLTEWGDITPKYNEFKNTISKYTEIPDIKFSTNIKKINYGKVHLAEKVSLFATLDKISRKNESVTPQTMEELGQAYGYIYYESDIGAAREVEDFRLIGTADRAHVFINEKLVEVRYDLDIENKSSLNLTEEANSIGILVENMGRVNYSVKMNHQKKGIKDGVIINGAFHCGWRQFSLPMDNLELVDFSKDWHPGLPSFYKFELAVSEIGDTFIDMSGWGKGFVVVNGFNIGRFWEAGPQFKLYIPGPILRIGRNEIIIFESDGIARDFVVLKDEPSIWTQENY